MISRKQSQCFKQSKEIITKSIKGFAYWCENREDLTSAALHTVEES